MASDLATSGYDRLEKAESDAEKKGRVVVKPRARELFLDIDSAEAWEFFLERVAKLREHVPLTYVVRPSPSGKPGRQHVVVTLERAVSPIERIALQAVLGSDLMRELLSYIRYARNDEAPTLFFETKGGPYDPGAPKLPKYEP